MYLQKVLTFTKVECRVDKKKKRLDDFFSSQNLHFSISCTHHVQASSTAYMYAVTGYFTERCETISERGEGTRGDFYTCSCFSSKAQTSCGHPVLPLLRFWWYWCS